MMIRLLHKLGIVKGVYLLDYENKVYITWLSRSKSYAYKLFGVEEGMYCRVFPFTGVGLVILDKGGYVRQPHYIKQWRYM